MHAIGGNKRVLYAAGRGTPVNATALAARECRGYYVAGPFDIRTGCTPELFFELIPHWSPMAFAETAPAPRALQVDWTRAGGSVRIPVTPASGHGDALDFRIAGEPGAAPVDIDVRVRDTSGAWTSLGSGPMTLRSYHGLAPLGKVVARQLRAPLRGLDASRITGIELIPRTARGRFWLLDVSTREGALAASGPVELPRISVSRLVVPEGRGGETTIELPVAIEGEVTKRARLWVQLTNFASLDDPTSGFPLVLEPGTTHATIPFTYRADDVYDPFAQVTQVTLLAQKNAVTGKFRGHRPRRGGRSRADPRRGRRPPDGRGRCAAFLDVPLVRTDGELGVLVDADPAGRWPLPGTRYRRRGPGLPRSVRHHAARSCGAAVRARPLARRRIPAGRNRGDGDDSDPKRWRSPSRPRASCCCWRVSRTRSCRSPSRRRDG